MALGLPSCVGSGTAPRLPRHLTTGMPLRQSPLLGVRHPSLIIDSRSSGKFSQRPCAARRSGGPAPPANPGAPPTPPSHGLVATVPLTEDDYVEVGKVTGAHGVQGELRLDVATDEPASRFKAGRKLFLLPPSGRGLLAQPEAGASSLIAVTSKGAKMRPLGKGVDAWMVALKEVTSRSQAELLRGYTVFCAVADRDRLRDPDEFYVTDIIGCTVVDQATRRLVGLVVDVYSGMGTHDTLRVKLRANEKDILNSRIRYCMIPFAKAICPVLDLKTRTLEVTPPEGLLELATEEPLQRPLSDETKAQKLQQLRELLRKEAEEDAARRQQQPAAAQGAESSDKEEDDEEGGKEGNQAEEEEEEDEDGVEEEVVQAAKTRRSGLRRRPGALRLGRRR